MTEPVFGKLLALVPEVAPGTLLLTQPKHLIGRLPDICDLVVNRRSVSRIHAEIERSGSHYLLRNRSRYETYIDGHPVRDDTILFNGNKIGLTTPEPLIQFLDDRETVLETAASLPRLRYEASTFTFYLDDAPLSLTPQQLTLLYFLYENSGTVCTREACESAVWGDNPVVEVSALHRLVSDLRASIAQIDPEAELIQTKRGVGYILQP